MTLSFMTVCVGVWSQERYDDVEKRLTPFLKQCGYNVKRDVQFIPISGLKGTNIKYAHA